MLNTCVNISCFFSMIFIFFQHRAKMRMRITIVANVYKINEMEHESTIRGYDEFKCS